MAIIGAKSWKLKRLTAGQEELDSNEFFREPKIFDLQECKVSKKTANASREAIFTVDNHGKFEDELPKQALTTAQIQVIEKLNNTSVTFWPYADNENFNFEATVQVEALRPYSGWEAIDIYKMTISSKKEVEIIFQATKIGCFGWKFFPDPGPDPTTTGAFGWNELQEP